MANSSGSSRRAALRAQQELEARRKRNNRILVVASSVIGVAIIGIVVAVLILSNTGKPAGEQATPPNAVAGYGVRAYPNADVASGAPTVVIWEDFQCPYCKYTADYYADLMHGLAEKGEITLEYKLVSFLDSGLGNDASHRAAMGATIADQYGKFVEYTDAVYANQPAKEGDGYSDELLRDTIPAQIGLTGDDLAGFQAAYDAKATDEFVTNTTNLFASEQIPGTPYISVNGKQVQLLGTSNNQLVPATELTEEALLAFLKENA